MKGEGQFSLLRNTPLLVLGTGHGVIDLCVNTLPVFYPMLVGALGLSYSSVAALTTVQTACSSLSQPFFGWMADRFGTRWLTSLSIAAAAVALALVGFLASYPALLLIVAALGLAAGAFHPGGGKAAALLSGRWRTTGISIYMVIANAGLASGPLLAATVLISAGLRGTTFLLPPALLVAALVFRAMQALDRGETRSRATIPLEKVGPIAWRGVAALVATIIVRSWVEYGLMAFVPLLYAARGEAPDLAGRILFLILVTEGTGSLLGGMAADRLGRKPVLACSFLLLAPALHFFVLSSGGESLLLAPVVGFLLGAPLTVTLAAAQEIVPSRMGMATGLAISSGMIVGGAGVSLQGVVADRSGLEASLALLVGAAVLATFASLALSGHRSRR